jgi:glycosyltransferase involved in cell wall biosynthesis
MKTSLVITTYNWKEALDLVLRSVARQSELPDEVIVADDGSRADTAEAVNAWKQQLSIPLIYVWQEDIGFRLARSRNRAVAAASGEYIIMIDGDMVLHRHFIADHKRAAMVGYFIQGVRLIARQETGKKMLSESILDLNFFSRGIDRRRHTIRNRLFSWLVYQHVRTDQQSIRGCNQAFWKADLLRVNGFDERMQGYGKEDNELVARLCNAGIRRRNLKFAALAIHLYHVQRKYPPGNPNDQLLMQTLQQKLTWCEHGLDQHVHEVATSK